MTPDDEAHVVIFGARYGEGLSCARASRLRDAAVATRPARAARPHLDPAADGLSDDGVDPLLAAGAVVAAVLAASRARRAAEDASVRAACHARSART